MLVNATFGSIVHAGIYRCQIPPVNATGQPCFKLGLSRFTHVTIRFTIHSFRPIRLKFVTQSAI